MENTVTNIQVDAVIPWVNGNDEKWQEKINNHCIVKLKLFWFEINKNKTFITCQSLEQANTKSLNYILNWINKRIE
jgi:hypothetical protein